MESNAGTIEEWAIKFKCPKNAQDAYLWMRFIVNTNSPFNCLENEEYRAIAKMTPITTKTMKQLMHTVGEIVMAKLTEILPEKFGIYFEIKK